MFRLGPVLFMQAFAVCQGLVAYLHGTSLSPAMVVAGVSVVLLVTLEKLNGKGRIPLGVVLQASHTAAFGPQLILVHDGAMFIYGTRSSKTLLLTT